MRLLANVTKFCQAGDKGNIYYISWFKHYLNCINLQACIKFETLKQDNNVQKGFRRNSTDIVNTPQHLYNYTVHEYYHKSSTNIV